MVRSPLHWAGNFDGLVSGVEEEAEQIHRERLPKRVKAEADA